MRARPWDPTPADLNSCLQRAGMSLGVLSKHKPRLAWAKNSCHIPTPGAGGSRTRGICRPRALCKRLQRGPSPRPSGLWHPEAGQLVPCKQPVSCHCKQLVSRVVVTVPKSQCDCPVTRYPTTGPCHLILGKQCPENGQQCPVWSVRCLSQGLGPT